MYACTLVLLLSGRVKLWADTFGRDLYDTVTKYSGSLLLQKVSATQGSWAVSQVVRDRDSVQVGKQDVCAYEGPWGPSNPIPISDGETEAQGEERFARDTEQAGGMSAQGPGSQH